MTRVLRLERKSAFRSTAAIFFLTARYRLIASAEASRELAARIPGAQLVMLEGLGHGLYEEDPAFQERVMEFGGKT